MTRRKIALSMVLLLCAAVFLSGTLLILHPDHECCQTTCAVCTALERRSEILCLLAAVLSGGLLVMLYQRAPLQGENQFLPDWTPVRGKVKLLN